MAITISTVGLGTEVNRDYLTRLAALAGGKAYFLNEPAGLDQIVLSDVKEHTGMTAVEKPLVPEVLHNAEILDDVAIASAPALKGYIRFEAKPNAEIVLRWTAAILYIRAGSMDWAAPPFSLPTRKRAGPPIGSTWKGYDKFWINVCRDCCRTPTLATRAWSTMRPPAILIARYRLGETWPSRRRSPSSTSSARITISVRLSLENCSRHLRRPRGRSAREKDLFRVRPVEDSEAFPEAALYRPEAELSEYGSDEALLKQVAEFTGGRFQPAAPTSSIPAAAPWPSRCSCGPGCSRWRLC